MVREVLDGDFDRVEEVVIAAGTPAVIDWNDITDHSDSDWNDTPDTLCCATLRTWAVLASDWRPNHSVVQLARDFDLEEDTFHGVRTMPCGAMVSIKNIRTGEEWELTRVTFRKVTA